MEEGFDFRARFFIFRVCFVFVSGFFLEVGGREDVRRSLISVRRFWKFYYGKKDVSRNGNFRLEKKRLAGECIF